MDFKARALTRSDFETKEGFRGEPGQFANDVADSVPQQPPSVAIGQYTDAGFVTAFYNMGAVMGNIQ